MNDFDGAGLPLQRTAPTLHPRSILVSSITVLFDWSPTLLDHFLTLCLVPMRALLAYIYIGSVKKGAPFSMFSVLCFHIFPLCNSLSTFSLSLLLSRSLPLVPLGLTPPYLRTQGLGWMHHIFFLPLIELRTD